VFGQEKDNNIWPTLVISIVYCVCNKPHELLHPGPVRLGCFGESRQFWRWTLIIHQSLVCQATILLLMKNSFYKRKNSKSKNQKWTTQTKATKRENHKKKERRSSCQTCFYWHFYPLQGQWWHLVLPKMVAPILHQWSLFCLWCFPHPSQSTAAGFLTMATRVGVALWRYCTFTTMQRVCCWSATTLLHCGECTISSKSDSNSCCHCEKSCCSISNFSSKSNFNCCQNCKKSHHIVFISSLNSNFSWSSHCHHEKSIHNKCNPSSSCSSRVALVGLVA